MQLIKSKLDFKKACFGLCCDNEIPKMGEFMSHRDVEAGNPSRALASSVSGASVTH